MSVSLGGIDLITFQQKARESRDLNKSQEVAVTSEGFTLRNDKKKKKKF